MRMKSRVDIKSHRQKEISDTEPEIPDDLEISSNNSGSLKFNIIPDVPLSSKLVKIILKDEATQTEKLESIKFDKEESKKRDSSELEKKKRVVKRVIKKLVRREPSSNRLLDTLEKTKREKERLERSIIKNNAKSMDSKKLIQLSMRYITKAFNGYNRYFLAEEGSNKGSKQRSGSKVERSDSNDTIGLNMNAQALASAEASELLKRQIFDKVLNRMDNRDLTPSKKRKKVKKIVKVRKHKSSKGRSQTPTRSINKSHSSASLYNTDRKMPKITGSVLTKSRSRNSIKKSDRDKSSSRSQPKSPPQK